MLREYQGPQRLLIEHAAALLYCLNDLTAQERALIVKVPQPKSLHRDPGQAVDKCGSRKRNDRAAAWFQKVEVSQNGLPGTGSIKVLDQAGAEDRIGLRGYRELHNVLVVQMD